MVITTRHSWLYIHTLTSGEKENDLSKGWKLSLHKKLAIAKKKKRWLGSTHDNSQLYVIISGGKWPTSPIPRSDTPPLGRIVMLVIPQCPILILSQASGGSWSALKNKRGIMNSRNQCKQSRINQNSGTSLLSTLWINFHCRINTSAVRKLRDTVVQKKVASFHYELHSISVKL